MERDCPAAQVPGVPANWQPAGLFSSRGCRRLVRGLSPQKSGSASGERQGAWQGLRMTLGWGSRVLFPLFTYSVSVSLGPPGPHSTVWTRVVEKKTVRGFVGCGGEWWWFATSGKVS